jgi:hypothetical protein
VGREIISAALAKEYRLHAEALQAGDIPSAWHHLERAHILAQAWLVPHIVSHGKMLAFAVAQRDWREAAGQILRLVLAPLGNLTGRLPFGNTGRSIVNAFAPMDIPPDLAVILTRGDE